MEHSDFTHGMTDEFVDALLDAVAKAQKHGISNRQILKRLECGLYRSVMVRHLYQVRVKFGKAEAARIYRLHAPEAMQAFQVPDDKIGAVILECKKRLSEPENGETK